MLQPVSYDTGLYLFSSTMVKVVYSYIYEKEYHQITGAVVSVDAYWSLLQIVNMAIDFFDILKKAID